MKMITKSIGKLPPSERSALNIGYMRLSDSAPIIVAQELGFYAKYGLNISLHREVSWANIRDKMITGTFDACQMLAPMVLATTLGFNRTQRLVSVFHSTGTLLIWRARRDSNARPLASEANTLSN